MQGLVRTTGPQGTGSVRELDSAGGEPPRGLEPGLAGWAVPKRLWGSTACIMVRPP